jgi:hypothetical protein
METRMKKTLTALVAAGTLAATLAGSATEASAQRGFGWGLATGLVGGAIIGSAIASSRPVYGAPVVVAPATCLVDQPVWSPRLQAYVMRRVAVAC